MGARTGERCSKPKRIQNVQFNPFLTWFVFGVALPIPSSFPFVRCTHVFRLDEDQTIAALFLLIFPNSSAFSAFLGSPFFDFPWNFVSSFLCNLPTQIDNLLLDALFINVSISARFCPFFPVIFVLRRSFVYSKDFKAFAMSSRHVKNAMQTFQLTQSLFVTDKKRPISRRIGTHCMRRQVRPSYLFANSSDATGINLLSSSDQ